MPGRPWTMSELAELRRLDALNLPVRDIALRMRRSYRAIEAKRLNLGMRRHIWTPSEEKMVILAMFNAGATRQQIADHVGVCKNTVIGITGPAPRPYLWTDKETKLLKRLRRDKYSQADMARILGRTVQAVASRYQLVKRKARVYFQDYRARKAYERMHGKEQLDAL